MVPHATQEAEARESFEPGRKRLQCAEIAPLHSSLGDRARLSQNKQTNKQQQQQKLIKLYFNFVPLCFNALCFYVYLIVLFMSLTVVVGIAFDLLKIVYTSTYNVIMLCVFLCIYY